MLVLGQGGITDAGSEFFHTSASPLLSGDAISLETAGVGNGLSAGSQFSQHRHTPLYISEEFNCFPLGFKIIMRVYLVRQMARINSVQLEC